MVELGGQDVGTLEMKKICQKSLSYREIGR